MISDLLSLSKEDAIINLKIEEVNMDELVGGIYRDYLDIAEMQNKTLKYKNNLKENIISSDKNKLRQLLLIFIDNAFKYTNNQDIISLILDEKDNKIICTIMDTGIGINEEDLKHIFDRFFRSDNVRNKDIDGSGIGLSIAKMISINLNCKINPYSIENEGTKFEIIIPKNIT